MHQSNEKEKFIKNCWLGKGMEIKELEEKILILKKKVEYFYFKKIAVHIVKKNKWFHNGIILEFQGDLLILNDEKKGAMPIYLIEIEEIEKKEVRNGNSK